MRYVRIALIIVLFNISNVFSQQLPDFIVANTNVVTEYFSMFAFTESESNKVDDDFLFTAQVLPRQNDTIITDTLFFGFNEKYAKMRIKMISISRNGVDYYSVDSFPISDTLKWKLVNNFRTDSILLRDSLLDIRISSETGILIFQMDKKYSIVKKDVFKILLDTIPLNIIVGLQPSQNKSITKISLNSNNKVLYINQHYSFLEGRLHNTLFNLAGKKQTNNNRMSNIYIAKSR